MMRGYRTIKQRGDLGRVTDLRDAITASRWDHCSRRASGLIFGASVGSAEAVIRQYLLIRVAGTSLNRALLRSWGSPGSKMRHPWPAEWRQVAAGRGVNARGVGPALLWQGYILLFWGYGVVSIGRKALDGLKAMQRRSIQHYGRYAYFDKLAAGNLPRAGADGRSHDVVTWYARWSGRVPGLDTLCHNVAGAARTAVDGVPVAGMDAPLPPLTRSRDLLRFVCWGAAASVLAAVDLLRGRWWHALLLSEASSAALAWIHAPERLARDYLFHNSGWIYRPLWTYEAARGGSRITMYFYSTNCETFKRADGYPHQANSWEAMTWPFYVVWDECQADFVRRAVGQDANVVIAGLIAFSGAAEDLPALPPRAVAVFDVQPWRPSGYQALGQAIEYGTPEVVNAFLSDICAGVRMCNGMMVLKRKRQVGNWLHPRYVALVDQLGKTGTLVAVDPDIAAVRVIEACDVVVSLPFTSTALLGRQLGKPSVYYDPHGIVQRDDRAAHGIPIVTGPAELHEWLSANLVPQDTVHPAMR